MNTNSQWMSVGVRGGPLSVIGMTGALWLACQAAPLLAQDSVSTFAGSALMTGATNGPRTNALFNDPAGLAISPDGTIFVADSANHTIRRIDTNGFVTTFAGSTGSNGAVNATGTLALFDTPTGLALDTAGNLFVTDTGNHTIRKITPAGVVGTLAGFAGASGFSNAVGTAARFNSPLGVCVSSNGTVFVSDSGNHCIRAITPGGAVSTFAGAPETWGSDDGPTAEARFNGPVGLALDSAGCLFVADANNHTIRKITPAGEVSTLAGLAGIDGIADGTGSAARFAKPAEVTVADNGNLLVADSFNHLIRQITPQGKVTTVTGIAREAGGGDGANRTARLFNPYGIALSPKGELIIGDTFNGTLRKVFVPFQVTLTLPRIGNHSVITWDAEIGARYRVQCRNTLSTDAWEDLGNPITATLPVMSVTNSVNESPFACFFRVLNVQ